MYGQKKRKNDLFPFSFTKRLVFPAFSIYNLYMQKKFDPEKIKALVLDLDGTTLLPDTTLGERTIQCLKKLISGGMYVLFATGRAVQAALPYCNAVGASGPMIFFNGAEVVEIPSGKALSVDLLDTDAVDFGIDIARSMNIHFQLFLPPEVSPSSEIPAGKWEALVMDKQTPQAQMYSRHTGISPVFMDLKKVIASDSVPGCVKAMFIADSSLHDEIRQKMDERFGSRINLIRSYPTFLEVLSAGVSKGKGLETVKKLLDLNTEQVMAFGDEENDLSMFSAAGFSAAPANASEKIRQTADIVFGSNAEEGLAAYLQENFLQKLLKK